MSINTKNKLSVQPHFGVALFALFMCLPIMSLSQDRTLSIRLFDMNNGLSQMKTTSIVLDSLGYIWVGTRSGLNRFDGQTIKTYYEEDGLLHNRIHDLMVHPNGQVYVLSFKGLSIYNGNTFKHFHYDFLEAEYRLNIDGYGHIWINRESEAWLFHEDSFTKYEKPGALITWDWDVKKIYWINSDSIYQFDDGQLKNADIPLYKHPVSKDRLATIASHHFQPHHMGAVLINQKWVTLRELIQQDNQIRQDYFLVRNDTLIIRSGHFTQTIDHNLIRPVDYLIHPNGDIWVACENGFAQIISSPFEHYSYNEVPYVWTINEDPKGNIICGTYGHGLYIKKTEENHFDKIMPGDIGMPNPPQIFHASSVRTPRGQIYFAGQNIYKWSKGLEVYTRQTSFNLKYDSVNHALITGGINGVQVYNLDSDKAELIEEYNQLHDNEYIQCVELDQHNSIWAGSYNGLSKIDQSTQQISNFTQSNQTLPFKSVFSIFCDREGIVWIGGDKGLAYYEEDEAVIHLLDLPMIKDNVKSLIDWNDQSLLIGTKTGLFIFNKEKFLRENKSEVYFFNHTNGYRGLEPGFTGFYRDRQNRIWVPSATSLDRIIPERIDLKSQSIQTHISSINGQSLAYHFDTTYILDRGQTDIQLDIRLIGTERPVSLGYSYCLDDEDWVDRNENAPLILNELTPGNHHIRVRPFPYIQSRQAPDVAQLKFNINTPFYKDPRFPIIAGTVLALLMAYLLYLLIRQYFENKRFQEQINKSKYLESQLLLSELNPHFIFNVLSSIQRKILLGDRDEAANYIVKLSKMIRNFLNASHRAHGDLNNYKQNNISIGQEIELITSYLEFERMKSDDHFQFQINIDESIHPEWTTIPPMLIQPFVENAIKHGLLLGEMGGHLWVHVIKSENSVVVTIEDDGIGRKAASEMNKNRTGHVSLGTLIIDQRVSLLNQVGYHIEVKTMDREPTGTIVKLIIKDQ